MQLMRPASSLEPRSAKSRIPGLLICGHVGHIGIGDPHQAHQLFFPKPLKHALQCAQLAGKVAAPAGNLRWKVRWEAQALAPPKEFSAARLDTGLRVRTGPTTGLFAKPRR